MDFKKVLLVCVTSLLLIAAVVFFFFNNSAPTNTEKPPMDAEVAKILQEVATKKEVAEGFKKAENDLHAVQNKLEEDMAAGFATRDSNLARLEAKVDNYHRIPPRASLPKINPAGNYTNRPVSAQRPAPSTSNLDNIRLVSARTTPAASSNSGDFVTRQEFERRNDSVDHQISRIQNLSLANTIAIDTAIARINRLIGVPSPPASDSARINSSIGPLARPRTEAPPPTATSERRHAY